MQFDNEQFVTIIGFKTKFERVSLQTQIHLNFETKV